MHPTERPTALARPTVGGPVPGVVVPLRQASTLPRARGAGRWFVGRTAQLRRMARPGPDRGGAAGDGDPPRLFLVHGPGGIGKSALLRRLADDARERGRAVALVRPGASGPDVAEVVDAVLSLRGMADPLMLVDGVEAAGIWGERLRVDVLPRVPRDATVVVAGRARPDPRWSGDPGCLGSPCSVELAELSPAEAETLLEARGVPPRWRPDVLRFAGGHPTALCLSADAVASACAGGDGVTGTAPDAAPHPWRPPMEVVRTLLQVVVDADVPSATHRRALEVCAHVGQTTVDVLRSEVDDAEADEIFDWLAGLPYVVAGSVGLRPHDLVRRLLDLHLRWRDPQRHAELHGRLWSHLAKRATSASSATAGSATSALVSLYRHRGVDVDADPDPAAVDAPARPVEHDYRPWMRDHVLRAARDSFGAQDAALVRFWLDHRPSAFHCYAPVGAQGPRAFLAWLRSDRRDAAETGRDPVMAAVWDHVEAGGLVRAGEEVAVARFVVTGAHGPAPATPLILHRIGADVLGRGAPLAAAYLALPGPGEHALAGVDVDLVAKVPGPDGRCWCLFAHDFRQVPLTAFLERSVPLGGDGREGPAGPVGVGRRGRVLTRDAVDAALRAALRDWHSHDALAANPLVRGRAAAEAAPGRPVEGLRRLVAEALERLREDPRSGPAHRAVVATYLDRSVTQEAAAARLGTPFSTYRRHLARGVKGLAEHLWAAEQHGVDA